MYYQKVIFKILTLDKNIIILLNKSDLVPEIVLNAWLKYFQSIWNEDILIICSSCTKENQKTNQEIIIDNILKCKITKFNKTVAEITGHTVSSILKYRNEVNLKKSQKDKINLNINSTIISTEDEDEISDEEEEGSSYFFIEN